MRHHRQRVNADEQFGVVERVGAWCAHSLSPARHRRRRPPAQNLAKPSPVLSLDDEAEIRVIALNASDTA
jgi:hypothetical protein